MRLRSLVALAALCLGGCAAAAKDQVLFVTSTSWGAQFAQTPPTASIAYDRAEGYYGPSYANGALPPIAAVFGSGGNIFAPQVRQLYTTGAAALLATRATGAEPGPSQLLSASDADKHIMFFGTGTTVGLKVGFGTTGTPDSLNFGYRRLEFSLIHLGRQIVAGGAQVDVYPSVLASIDTTSNATSAADTGIHVQQFFATGQAADALASSTEVQSIIRGVATGSLAETLTVTQLQQAQAAGLQDSKVAVTNLAAIKGCVVAGDGTFAASKWTNLVSAAKTNSPKWNADDLAALTNWPTIQARIGDDQPSLKALSGALPLPPSSC